ncbi:MAG: hypothetical protein AABY42_09360 [Nitrospirota bacterium]
MKFQIPYFIFHIRRILLCCSIALLLCLSFQLSAFGSEWKGVDESVVKKFAKEHGREAKDPLINTDQGDLLLFVFLLAGAVGGFAAGYYWHVLITEKVHRDIKKDYSLSAPKDK